MKKILTYTILLLLLVACGAEEADPTATVASTDEPTATAASTDEPTATAASTDEPTATAESTDEPTATAESSDNTGDGMMVGIDAALFFENALSGPIETVDCTLSDGTESTCYQITVVGYPVNHDIGPFCPETITTGADQAGIWFDGDGVYDLDGEFIVGLADYYDDSNWQMYDDAGNVNITETAEEFDGAARPNVAADLQNHCVEGRIEWLDNGEAIPTTVTIPVTPIDGASASSTNNANVGITLNGVVIAAPAPVDAILSAYTIAAFDDCGGHFNPFDGYHLHGAIGCSSVGEAEGDETPIFAYAMDGYAIHTPFADEASMAAANLDACNGHTTEAEGYHYHAGLVKDNEVLPCYTGLTVTIDGHGDLPEDNQQAQGEGPNHADLPDFAAAAESLGVSEMALRDALGGPPPNLTAAAATLGVSEATLREALGQAPQG